MGKPRQGLEIIIIYVLVSPIYTVTFRISIKNL